MVVIAINLFLFFPQPNQSEIECSCNENISFYPLQQNVVSSAPIEINPIPEIIQECSFHDDFDLYMKYAEEFSKLHNYSRKDYNCLDFAKDQKEYMRTRGITNVDIVIGKRKTNTSWESHAWNRVCYYIEPQTATIVNGDLNYQ